MGLKIPTTAVFIDNDGSVYYYCGGFLANAVKLNDDMEGNGDLTVTLNGKPLNDAEKGLNDVVLTVTGDIKVHAACFSLE